ncbi:hypothetical protein IT568_04815 [bacterium]|nr:hypothetical protein [bacterium]
MNFISKKFSDLTIVDWVLVNAFKFVLGLLLGALFAPFIKKNKRWLIGISMLFATKPAYDFLIKRIKSAKQKKPKILDEEEMLFV